MANKILGIVTIAGSMLACLGYFMAVHTAATNRSEVRAATVIGKIWIGGQRCLVLGEEISTKKFVVKIDCQPDAEALDQATEIGDEIVMERPCDQFFIERGSSSGIAVRARRNTKCARTEY